MSTYGKEINRCLKKVRKGEDGGLKELIDRSACHLHAVALLYSYDKSYCEDVVLETYERAVRYIHSFDPKKDGYNWLCKIAQKVAYEYNEREQKQYKAIRESKNRAIAESWDTVVETRVDLQTAFGDITEQEKNILYRRFYLEETFAEIGRELGLNKSVVYKIMKKLLQNAKNFWENGND